MPTMRAHYLNNPLTVVDDVKHAQELGLAAAAPGPEYGCSCAVCLCDVCLCDVCLCRPIVVTQLRDKNLWSQGDRIARPSASLPPPPPHPIVPCPLLAALFPGYLSCVHRLHALLQANDPKTTWTSMTGLQQRTTLESTHGPSSKGVDRATRHLATRVTRVRCRIVRCQVFQKTSVVRCTSSTAESKRISTQNMGTLTP